MKVELKWSLSELTYERNVSQKTTSWSWHDNLLCWMSIEGAERKLRPDLNINNNSLGDKTTNQNIMIVFNWFYTLK